MKLSIFETGSIVKNSGIYFKLEDNGDSKKITILDNIDEIELNIVHVMKDASGTDRHIKCLGTINKDGKFENSNCTLCGEGIKLQEKVYLKVFNYDEQANQVWTLNKSIISKILHIAKKRPDFSNHKFEITRIGKKGDIKTSYEIDYDGECDMTKENKQLKSLEFSETVCYELDEKQCERLLIEGTEILKEIREKGVINNA